MSGWNETIQTHIAPVPKRTLAPAISNPVDAKFKAAMERLQADLQANLGGVRTPSDYAIEFGEYLAKAAEAYMDDVNKVCARLVRTTVDFSDLGGGHRALASAVYEFRKRAARARP